MTDIALGPLMRCPELASLLLTGGEFRCIDVYPLAESARLVRFDPVNFKEMVMAPMGLPIESPGLRRWQTYIAID